MLKKTLLAVGLLTASTAVQAGPTEGDWEIVFTDMGAFFSTSGNDDTGLLGSVRAGYFLDSHHEVGAGAKLTVTEDDESLGLDGFYRYNWATEASDRWWYAGVDLDIENAEEAGDTLQLRPHFGRKWMLTDDVSFDLNLGLDIDADNSDSDPVFDAQWGITVFFK